MKTVILSDLHLGNGQGYDIFAGEEDDALVTFLDSLASSDMKHRVFLNGDSVDFLMNEDALTLEPERAVQQARSIVAHPPTAAVFAALGRVLAAGGEVMIRMGNHDIELALAEVQHVFRLALNQPEPIARGLEFHRGDSPDILQVGNKRLLLTHGEDVDPFNKVEFDALPGPGGPARVSPEDYPYSAGSRLVKTMVNPLKRRFGMRFVDLLHPDFQGAVLAAMAVNPEAVKLLFQTSTLGIFSQLMRKAMLPAAFGPEEETEPVKVTEVRRELEGMFWGVSSDIEELAQEELEALDADPQAGAASFAGEENEVLDRARLKLVKAGLRLYAAFHKWAVGHDGERFFSLEPTERELLEARRLHEKFKADAVIFGHTHAARWKQQGDLLYANTGAWVWLMRLPPADASDDQWTGFLEELIRNPGLKPDAENEALMMRRLTAVTAERDPVSNGVRVALVEWDAKARMQRPLRTTLLLAD